MGKTIILHDELYEKLDAIRKKDKVSFNKLIETMFNTLQDKSELIKNIVSEKMLEIRNLIHIYQGSNYKVEEIVEICRIILIKALKEEINSKDDIIELIKKL